MTAKFIGQRIKAAREQALLRQCDLADAVGICTRGYQNWELGYSEPKLSRLMRIAQITEKPISFFVPEHLVRS